MTAQLVVLVPVLTRPRNVEPLIRSLAAATSCDYRLLFIAESVDSRERTELRRCGADVLLVARTRRRYACKINDAVRATDEPLIFLAADDVRFHEGWDSHAIELLDETIEVVGTNDLLNPRVIAGTHSTHSLLTRRYAERGSIDDPNVVLHEGYPHEYVDDEFVQTALARGVMVFARDSIVEHLHPYNHKADVDATYRLGWQGRAVGKKLFDEREKLWTSTSA